MYHYNYVTEHTCSQLISLDLDGDVVKNISFMGGCNGNLQGISKLVEGMTVDKIEEKLQGIKCGRKPTSCPDQLAKAVRKAYEAQKKGEVQEVVD
ncbi:MAG: TIGR03905 family TSCPD domain-containing protein [Parasporobacterium sp.]|nr:TIGR03905 family TSCPD domain-containing protein [Parasporobacterium sp.]